MRKRMTIFLLVTVMLLSLGAHAAADGPQYSDISGHWAEQMIKEFTAEGYLTGYDDGTFRPDAPITRAEAAAFVARLGLPETLPEVAFDDVDPDDWYYDFVMKAAQAGFIDGYPDNTFRAVAFILREEAAKLASYFWIGVDMEGFELTFSDRDDVSAWAKADVEKVVKMELLGGYTDNTLRPRALLSRAEFVKIFYKVFIDPVYASVTVRAVSMYNLDHDIVDPAVYALAIGEEVQFDAPTVPSDWILEGPATQFQVVAQGLVVTFKYWPYSPLSPDPAPNPSPGDT